MGSFSSSLISPRKTNCVMRFLSSKTTKSPLVRPVTGLPFLSSTETSRRTMREVVLSRSSCGVGAVDCAGATSGARPRAQAASTNELTKLTVFFIILIAGGGGSEFLDRPTALRPVFRCSRRERSLLPSFHRQYSNQHLRQPPGG